MRALKSILLFAGICASAFPAYAQSDLAGSPVNSSAIVKDNVLTIDARYGPPTVPVKIGDDVYTFLVEPSFGPVWVVNTSIAEKHEISNVNFLGLKSTYEGTKLKVKGGGIDVEIGDSFKDKNKVLLWFEKDIFPPFDGMIGAASFKKFDKVVFLLSDVSAKQKLYSAPLVSKKRWGVKSVLGEGKRLKAFYLFSLQSEHSFTNLVLSQTLKDKSMVIPEQTVFDITKIFSSDVKLINSQLKTPISLMRGDITEIKMEVPASSLTAAEGDAVVVKARSKKKKAKEPPQIYLGRDYFIGCTSLEFTREEKRVDLFCDDDGR